MRTTTRTRKNQPYGWNLQLVSWLSRGQNSSSRNATADCCAHISLTCRRQDLKGTKFERLDGFHALRHSYVSTLIEYGVTNIKRLQMLLGHSSAMITLDTYTHLLPDSDDGIAVAAESALFDSGSKTVAVESETGAVAPVNA